MFCTHRHSTRLLQQRCQRFPALASTPVPCGNFIAYSILQQCANALIQTLSLPNHYGLVTSGGAAAKAQ